MSLFAIFWSALCMYLICGTVLVLINNGNVQNRRELEIRFQNLRREMFQAGHHPGPFPQKLHTLGLDAAELLEERTSISNALSPSTPLLIAAVQFIFACIWPKLFLMVIWDIRMLRVQTLFCDIAWRSWDREKSKKREGS
jgi:hypothetical protein